MANTAFIVVGVIAAIILLAVGGLYTAYTIVRMRTRASKSELARKRVSDMVVFAGPNGAGKTALMHRLATGTVPETVMSVKRGELRSTLASERADAATASHAKSYRLVDIPGHAQMRMQLLADASVAAGLILVLDAAAIASERAATSTRADVARGAHIRAAADALYDLFTTPAVHAARPAVMIVCNKSDLLGAATAGEVQDMLQAQLESLKHSRPSVATADADASQLDGSASSNALVAGTLLLGAQDRKFSFKADAPCDVTVVAASARTGTGLEAINDFIATCTMTSST